MQDEKFSTLLFRGIKNKLKELFNLLFKFFLIFLVIVLLGSSLMVIYGKTDEDKRIELLSELNIEHIDYCYTNNTGDIETLTKIDNFINAQPIYVKDMFFEQDWAIAIERNISNTFVNSVNVLDLKWDKTDTTKLKGVTVPETKIIYLSNKNINSEELYKNFIHEFGHFYNYINGNISMSYSFKNIYKMNKYSNLYTAEEKDNVTEFFAASYALYKLEPTKLEDDSPDVYDYIKETENKLEKRNIDWNKRINFLFGMIIEIKIAIIELYNQLADFTF